MDIQLKWAIGVSRCLDKDRPHTRNIDISNCHAKVACRGVEFGAGAHIAIAHCESPCHLAGASYVQVAEARGEDIEKVEAAHCQVKLRVEVSKFQHSSAFIIAADEWGESQYPLHGATFINLCIAIEVGGTQIEIKIGHIEGKHAAPCFRV